MADYSKTIEYAEVRGRLCRSMWSCSGCPLYKKNLGDNRDVVVGAIYRHFKGNLVKVLAVSQDTEHPGAWSVVYQSLTINPGTIWHRPYDMFVSEVDHKKYPDEVQKYRFELVR